VIHAALPQKWLNVEFYIWFPSQYTRPRVFQKRLLKGIFRPRMKEVIGGRRKVHNEEINLVFHAIIRLLN
jgi:hypothetical protein